jgi:hypothetical protein
LSSADFSADIIVMGGEKSHGKNLGIAGETNFFLASEVVFFGVQVNISCEGAW